MKEVVATSLLRTMWGFAQYDIVEVLINMLLRRILKYSFISLTLAAIFVTGVISDVQFRYVKQMYEVGDAPQKPVAIILGASVKKDGTPSDALRDRVLTGIDLYRTDKVQTLFMTGDDGARHIDEVSVMANLAKEAGIPPEDIKMDGHGYRTYESCKRAAQEYDIQEAIVVTQRFHLARALYLCNGFGMDAVGVTADRQNYVKYAWFWTRDLLSSFKAFWDLHVWAPAPPV